MQHDLDQLCVAVAGILDRLDISIGDVAAGLDELDGEADCRCGLGIAGTAVAVGCDFDVGELGQVLAEIGMRGQAVVAAVDFGDGQRDALAGRGLERTLGQRAVEAEIAFQRGRAGADQAEQVRHRADLLLDGLQQRLRGGGRGFDRGGGGEAGHVGDPFNWWPSTCWPWR